MPRRNARRTCPFRENRPLFVSLRHARTSLARLIAAVERGERVIITRNGVPIVELVPPRLSALRIGRLRDQVGPVPDAVLAPMSDEELRIWEQG